MRGGWAGGEPFASRIFASASIHYDSAAAFAQHRKFRRRVSAWVPQPFADFAKGASLDVFGCLSEPRNKKGPTRAEPSASNQASILSELFELAGFTLANPSNRVSQARTRSAEMTERPGREDRDQVSALVPNANLSGFRVCLHQTLTQYGEPSAAKSSLCSLFF